jgi:hypothetical protein
MDTLLAYLGAGLVAAWGVAHAIPTRQVIAGYEPISTENRWILTQEWLAESVTMWGIAAAVVAVVVAEGIDSGAATAVFPVLAGLLVALAVLTAITGARTAVIWFKICPVLLTTSALLLVAAVVL